jgi:predicted dehydrogenase
VEQTGLRAGVIGIGVMGWNHARSLRQLPGVALVGVVDHYEDLRLRARQEFGCEAFANAEDLFKCGVDIVVVATPNRDHFTSGMLALKAGAHVLMEKPIAATVEEAQGLIDAAQAGGRTLMVGHIERFNPAVVVAQKACADQQVISINLTRVGPFPPRMSDIGVVIDLAVHDIDLIRMLSGSDIVDVQAQLRGAMSQREDTALLQFRTANGVIAGINTNWVTPFKVRTLHIAATQKYVVADLLTRQVQEFFDFKVDGSFSVRHLSVPQVDALREEQLAFVNAVRTGAPSPITGADGLQNLRIAVECLRGGVRNEMFGPF